MSRSGMAPGTATPDPVCCDLDAGNSKGGASGGAKSQNIEIAGKKAGRGWHHHSRALRRRLMGQGE
jgi:hypothetical protein